MARQGGKNRGCVGCGLGISAFAAFWVIVFAANYASRGHYRPYVPTLPALPVPNALDDYIAASRILDANGGLKSVNNAKQAAKDYQTDLIALNAGRISPSSTPVPKPPDLLKTEQQFVAKNAGALQRMRLGFAKGCRVPAMRDMGGAYPYMSGLRNLSSLLEVDADVRRSHGDHIGACKDAIDTLRLANHMVQGGNVFHVRVAAKLSDTAAKIEAQSIDELTLRQCDDMADELERLLRKRPRIGAALREEGYSTLSSLRILDDPKQMEQIDLGLAVDNGDLTVYTIEAKGPPGLIGGASASYARMRWHNERDEILKDIESFYKIAEVQADRPAALRQPMPAIRNSIEKLFAYLSNHTLHPLDAALARERLIYCMLKLRSFQLKENRYPSSLNELNAFTAHLIDPYTGQPLIYRRTSTGYLLYSVGPNLKDDGGIPLHDDTLGLPGDIGIVACRKQVMPTTLIEGYPTVLHMNAPVPASGASPSESGVK